MKHSAKIIHVGSGTVTVAIENNSDSCSGCSLASACKKTSLERVDIPVADSSRFSEGQSVTVSGRRPIHWWLMVIVGAMAVITAIYPTKWQTAAAIVICAVLLRYMFLSTKPRWKIVG